MDFIERWFGLFPDGGNGSLEALYLGTALFAIAVVRLCRRLSPTGCNAGSPAVATEPRSFHAPHG